MQSSAQLPIRWLVLLAALLGILPSVGCRLCCETDDDAYAAYGGAWQRTRRDAGRVGSLFDPAGAKAATLVQRDEPRTPDVLDRERRRGEPDAFSLEPDKDPSQQGPLDDESPEPTEDDEQAMRRRLEELRRQGLEDINFQPDEVAPPTLY